MTNATKKQESYIIDLYNRKYGTDCGYLSQCRELPLTQREKRGGMTKAEASAYIRQLQR
jgi:hypothetical protein